ARRGNAGRFLVLSSAHCRPCFGLLLFCFFLKFFLFYLMFFPPPRAVHPPPGGGGGGGGGPCNKIDGACKRIHMHTLTPSPTLPRKPGREQTEFAARADSAPHEQMP